MLQLKLHPKIRILLHVFSANVFNNFSSFVVIILAARLFSPAEFSKLTIAVAVTTNLSSVLDFGTSFAVVRLYNAASNNKDRISLIRTITKWKICLSILTILLSYPGGKFIIEIFPILKDTGLLIYLAIISGGMLSIWATTRAIEQAQKKFYNFQKYTLLYGFFRLITAVIFMSLNQISITAVIISLYIAPLAILITYINTKEILSCQDKTLSFNLLLNNEDMKSLKSIFNYGFFVGISSILFSLIYQAPQFILSLTSNNNEVGFYGAGLTFLPILLLTNDTVRTIVLPDVSAINNVKDRNLFRKRLIKLFPIFFSSMLLFLITISFIQYFLLGEAYQASIPVFLAMGSSTILVMYLGYFNTLIHSIGIPYVGTLVNISSTIMFIFLSIFIPKSAFSMSLLLGIVLIAGELFTCIYLKNIDIYKI